MNTDDNGKPAYRLVKLQTVDSTSNYLNSLCVEADDRVADFTTVTAEFQQAGKGQRGNSWESECGQNLLFSFVLYPTFVTAGRQFIISQTDAVALKETLEQYTTGITIKWPNDIYWHDRKISGMLIEVFLQGNRLGRCISGIGVNINQTTFRSDAPNPVSLKQITGHETDRQEFLGRFMSAAARYYAMLEHDFEATAAMIERKYDEALYRRHGMHRYRDKDGEFMAEIVGVQPDGRFILRDGAGSERTYLFKEVQYII